MKLAIAGKGGVGKTTVTALAAKRLATDGAKTLAVDCDPNPMLAEEFGLSSSELERFDHSGLARAGDTLALTRAPPLLAIAPQLWLLGGPPTPTALADAVARGIAGVLVADDFDHVITDLGAGPEFTRIAVGGALDPAELCIVLTDGTPGAARAALAVEAACHDRGVASLVVPNVRGEPGLTAMGIVARARRDDS